MKNFTFDKDMALCLNAGAGASRAVCSTGSPLDWPTVFLVERVCHKLKTFWKPVSKRRSDER
jgi:hypothetical protein